MAEEMENSEVFNHYLELSKPTKEDFERVFTEEELKELCLKQKCSVDMYRWNVVNDYRIVFTNSGRYQRWSERDRLRMLAKAVNKMKPSVLYSEEDILKTRKEEWEIQLKDNILSLNYWHRKRNNNARLKDSEPSDMDREIQSQCEVNTESMNIDEAFTQSESIPTIYRELDQDLRVESMNSEEIVLQNQEELEELRLLIQEDPPARNEEVLTEEENLFLNDLNQQYLSDEEDSEDSIKTVLHNKIQRERLVETLHSEEVAPEIENIYGVNTMSMTIDSQMSTQSQNLAPSLQSQDVIPSSYDNFKNIIPLTSTQSQNDEKFY